MKRVLCSSRDDDAIKSDATNLLLLSREAATLKYFMANLSIVGHVRFLVY